MLKRTPIYLTLIGAAGSGKSSIAESLERNLKSLKRVITTTSRAPRPSEVDGKDYYFVSRDEFERELVSGAFIEWEETHGNYYGTSFESLHSVVDPGLSPLLVIDIRGAMTLREKFPHDLISVFIIPPSKGVLKTRIEARGTSKEELKTRLDTAVREHLTLMENLEKIDYLVVNENLSESIGEVSAIYVAECSRAKRLNPDSLKSILG
jgi:guanylate kinase